MTSTRRDRRHAVPAPSPLADLFAVVADRTRLSLLLFLMSEEHCVTQCSEHIGLTHSAASKQLNTLAAAGLVTSRADGRRRYYRVTDPEATTTILHAAQSFVAGQRRSEEPPVVAQGERDAAS